MFCQGQLIKIFIFFTIVCFAFSCSKNNSKWSYEGKNGSKFWGNITENYKFCKIGYNQSPININLLFDNNNLSFLYQKGEINKKIMPHLIKNTIFVSNNARPLQKFEPQKF
jgi:carbonic anhydrase